MKFLKTYQLFESMKEQMISNYGIDAISECDSIISDIEDMLLELSDKGFFVIVGYTPLTLTWREKIPKIMVEVQGDLSRDESNDDIIKSCFERVKEYVKSKGYSSGFGSWDRSDNTRTYKIYQMLIQK